jgi:hypothetical protein
MRGPAGARGSRNARRAVGVLVAGLSLLAPGLVGGVAGCGKPPQPTTRPLTARERQDQALRDPFGYSPDIESTDISGGGLSEFDKEAFRKDLKNVLDP